MCPEFVLLHYGEPKQCYPLSHMSSKASFNDIEINVILVKSTKKDLSKELLHRMLTLH